VSGVEEPPPAEAFEALQVAECAAAPKRPDRLAPVRGDHVVEPGRYLLERLVPGDALEPPRALGTDAAQRMHDPVRLGRVLQPPVDLAAQARPW
jgi:hypothetical protein